jgi:hypothetical protein
VKKKRSKKKKKQKKVAVNWVSRVLQESLNFGAVTVSWEKKKKKKIVLKNFATKFEFWNYCTT